MDKSIQSDLEDTNENHQQMEIKRIKEKHDDIIKKRTKKKNYEEDTENIKQI